MREPIRLPAPRYVPALVGSRPHGASLLASVAATTAAAASPARAAEPEPIADPEVRRDIAQFTRALAAAKLPAQLLGNPVVLRILLTAHGMADHVGNAALATRVLLSNPARSNSLLNQLTDKRWLEVNGRYQFATKGLAVLRNPATMAALIRRYVEAREVGGVPTAPVDAPGTLAFPPRSAAAG